MVRFGAPISILIIRILRVKVCLFLGDELVDAKKKAKDEIFFIIDQIKKNKYNLILLKEKRQQIMKEI